QMIEQKRQRERGLYQSNRIPVSGQGRGTLARTRQLPPGKRQAQQQREGDGGIASHVVGSRREKQRQQPERFERGRQPCAEQVEEDQAQSKQAAHIEKAP